MKLILQAINNPKWTFLLAVLTSLVLLAFIPFIQIDTDPENMLSEDERVRVMHNELKDRYNMYDIIVLGVVNEDHPNGVFNKSSLGKVHELTEYIYTLQEKEAQEENETRPKLHGVIRSEVMAPSNVDHMAPDGQGSLKFDWLMSGPPSTEEEALEVKKRLLGNELFKNTLVSEDGKALCIYVPISDKDVSYEISTKIQEKVKEFEGEDQFHITGLPVAEDTFGIEMFIQMAFTAPAAMLFIFLLLWFFFRKIRLIFSPMIVAMLSVISTMGLLIATGNTVHIMSSMIPIFVMPIAVLDSIHILSEFFDLYGKGKNKRDTIIEVMHELFKPMLFTSLTSAAGFASLALTPIPPVQVFGIFVAIGILLAWLFTITLIPAYIILMPEKSLEGFGMNEGNKNGLLNRFLKMLQGISNGYPKIIVMITLALFGLAIYGMTKIEINDNPIKWFNKSHPIRVADKALNEHFGGTYMAFLNLAPKEKELNKAEVLGDIELAINNAKDGSANKFLVDFDVESFILQNTDNVSVEKVHEQLGNSIYDLIDNSQSDEEMESWEEVLLKVELDKLSREQVFKNPKILAQVEDLSAYLVEKQVVGKVNSFPKLVSKINKELHDGNEAFHKLPDDISGVGQCVLSFQNSHHPERLRHYVDSDYRNINMWLQLKSGDNKDMEKTIEAVTQYFEDNPNVDLEHEWYGLTYINVVWQQKMVEGMLKAFLGSFVIVFLMMLLLFRSFKWSLLCMLPLSFTIALIYGFIGFIGKDYDMPVAVLSSLALGLAIDFSIHFLVRAREKMDELNDWPSILEYMFGEPSRAISRNVLVIAIGFLPLLLSSLVPYKTVGVLLASILALSGLVTLVLLPALLKLTHK